MCIRDRLLSIFFDELSEAHGIEGIKFQITDIPESFELGVNSSEFFHLQFRLQQQQKLLGLLTVYRKKGFLSPELRCIETFVERYSGPLNNAVMYSQACHAAYRDKMTGLYNRAAFDLYFLRLATKKAFSVNESTMLMVCDIDGFKSINDTHGHLAGDEALKLIAVSLTSSVRDTDLVFRYGGDEFIVVLPNTTEKAACLSAETIRRSVELSTHCVDRQHLILTTTIGVARLSNPGSFEKAFLEADLAMLRGKKQGKNRVVYANA